jgi:hypothetical protein
VSTGVPAVEFIGLPTGKNRFTLTARGLQHDDASTQTWLIQLYTGSAWRTTGYLSTAVRMTASVNGVSATDGVCTNQTAIGASDWISFIVDVYDMTESGAKSMCNGNGGINRGSAWEPQFFSGVYGTTEAHTGIRIIPTGGCNIVAGTIELWAWS